METRASYLIVGLFVIAGMVGMLAAAIWITGTRSDQSTALYDIYFEGSVTGLRTGNPVQYRGIPVGAVASMRIDPENVERVLVTIEITAGTPVKADTEAMLAMQGITGVAFIQLTGGTQAASALTAAAGQTRPVIASRPSQISELLEAAPELMRRAIGVIDQAERLLGPENQARISASLDNIEALTGTLAKSSDDIETILSEGASMMAELNAATGRANRMLADMEGSAKGMGDDTREVLAETSVAIRQLGQASGQLARFFKQNGPALDDFGSAGLYEFSQLLAESRVLVGALNRLTSEFERDPARFLFGDQQQGVEVE